MHTLAPRPRICPECRDADLRELGYSFVHRQHQLLGVTMCWKHRVSLDETEFDIASQLPSDDRPQSRRQLQRTPLAPMGQRFHEVVERMLKWTSARQPEIVRKRFMNAAHDRNIALRGRKQAGKTSLDQWLKKRSLEDWNWAVKARTAGWYGTSDVKLPILDTGLYVYSSQVSTVVITALALTETSEEALHLLDAPTLAWEGEHGDLQRQSDNDCRRVYVTCRGKMDLIRDRIHQDGESVRTRFLRMGLRDLRSISPERFEALMGFKDGQTIALAAKHAGITSSELEELVREAALLNLRTMSRAWGNSGSIRRGARVIRR